MNERFHAKHLTGIIITAAAGLAVAALLGTGASVALAGPPKTTTYIGTPVWFNRMRQLPVNVAMLRQLAHTNFIVGVPDNCVEVAGTVDFPDGSPFPGPGYPEMQIYCRDQAVDSVARKIKLDDAAHFYTAFVRGQKYDFYWKLPSGRERFCSLQVGADAQSQHSLTITYPPNANKPPAAQNPNDVDMAVRSHMAIANEYDLSGFPAYPQDERTKRIAQAMRTSTSTDARANAHEMLAKYYADRGDGVRSAGEYNKAASLRQGLVNEPPSTVILK